MDGEPLAGPTVRVTRAWPRNTDGSVLQELRQLVAEVKEDCPEAANWVLTDIALRTVSTPHQVALIFATRASK